MNKLPFRVPFSAVLSLLVAAATVARADEHALRQCRGLADAAQRLACYDAIVLRPVAPAAAAAPAPAPEADRFGRAAAPERPERVETRIEGRFEGWGPRQRIRLANGQVWQVTDDSRGDYWLDSPRVVVRRAALGGFVLEIEGVNALLRVRRVD